MFERRGSIGAMGEFRLPVGYRGKAPVQSPGRGPGDKFSRKLTLFVNECL